jgi:ribonuclease Y
MMYALAALIGALAGAIAGYLFGAKSARELNRAEQALAQAEADKILLRAREDAQTLAQKAEIDAQKAELALKEKAEGELQAQRNELKQQRQEAKRAEERLEQRDLALTKREGGLDKREESLDRRASMYDRKEEELDKREKLLNQRDEKIKVAELGVQERLRDADEAVARAAAMTPAEAKELLIQQIEGEARIEGARKARVIEDEAVEDAERKAKKIIGVAIQRYAGEYVTERTVSVLPIPNDDVKGRIIGREGRNIRALEAATGINLIIDDTPEAVILSGFDPVRREVARLALERLISDGRIHPSRIEEVVEKTRVEVDKQIKEAGEKAAFELGLHGIHAEILSLIGRLRYRTSYGQNIWQHSIEVGFLCGLMAAELGLNVKLARRCGLLHDMGKALTHEMEGSHALIGGDYCKKYGENAIVTNAVAGHHEEIPITSVYTHLVMAADALSGARPGARREILENYVRRLEDLERISSSFKGVEKSYAVQAGREIRVMVEHSRVSDEEASLLSRDIARKIEAELTYPGQIKVCVIRETRAVDYAR